jgi:chromosome segregation ATPase
MEVTMDSLEKEKVEFIERKKREEELYSVIKSSLVESNREVETLENDKKNLSREIENYVSEIKHYIRQIGQLKEENKLTLSATNLLKISNGQLEAQLKTLTQNRDK